MSKGWKIYGGRPYQDPRGFFLTPRRTFLDDPLLYHPDTGRPVAPFHEWMAWQYLVWACVYEGGGRSIFRDGMTVRLARGQCLYSLDYLRVAWGWKAKSRVSRFLSKLEAEGRVRLDWPSYKYTEPKAVHSGATPSAARTGLVNPQSRLLTNGEGYMQPPKGRRVQRKTQRLGRLITVLNYDTYQSIDFYSATVLATSGKSKSRGVAGRSRDDRETNKKSLKSKKERPRATSAYPPSSQHPVDKEPEPITWDSIRGLLALGLWANLPAHIQEAQLQEALAGEPHVPEDLRAHGIINGCPNPEADRLTQLRQVKAMLKGDV